MTEARHTGLTAEILAGYFKTLDSFLELKFESLLTLYEVGEKMAESLVNHVKQPAFIDMIRELQSLGQALVLPAPFSQLKAQT